MAMDENYEETSAAQVPQGQPEEKKGGSTMRKLIYGLLAAALLVLTAVVFAQSSSQQQGEQGGEVISTVPHGIGTPLGWEIKHGEVTVAWILNESVTDNQIYANTVSPSTNSCAYSVGHNAFDGVTPRYVAEVVGRCFFDLERIAPPGKPWLHYMADVESFMVAYGSAYIDSCGDLFQPLAWNNIQDGQCELPDPQLVANETFGWLE